MVIRTYEGRVTRTYTRNQKNRRKRIDVSDEAFDYISKQLKYPEQLGDTLDRILGLRK
jgi:hypothetical protein